MSFDSVSNPTDDTFHAELNAWLDETTEPITDDDLNEMYRRDQEYQQSLYQQAKERFETLHPFSRPDSLTRRGNVLIARRLLTVDQALMRSSNGEKYAIEDWRETIERLFQHHVTIYSIDIDRKNHLRVRFTPHSLVKLHDGSYQYALPEDVDWLSWCAERHQGYGRGY